MKPIGSSRVETTIPSETPIMAEVSTGRCSCTAITTAWPSSRETKKREPISATTKRAHSPQLLR